VKAWELGAANYYKWKNRGLTILDVHESWNTYKPATLPDSTQAPVEISVKQIEKNSRAICVCAQNQLAG